MSMPLSEQQKEGDDHDSQPDQRLTSVCRKMLDAPPALDAAVAASQARCPYALDRRSQLRAVAHPGKRIL